MTIESAKLSSEEIRRRVGEFEWYHTIDLGGGITTPGAYNLEPLLPHYGLPASLEGKSVLDVGPGHGYFAFEFERRGAAKVATSELPTWTEHDASPELQEFFQPRAGVGGGIRPRRVGVCHSGQRVTRRAPLPRRVRPDAERALAPTTWCFAPACCCT